MAVSIRDLNRRSSRLKRIFFEVPITPKPSTSIRKTPTPMPPEAMLMGKKASGTARSKITPRLSASIRKMLPPTARAVLLTTVKEITTARSKTIARRSRLMAKALPYGMVAVGCVQLLANCSRHYRIAISHWICNPTTLMPATVALFYLKMGKVEDAIADYNIALGSTRASQPRYRLRCREAEEGGYR